MRLAAGFLFCSLVGANAASANPIHQTPGTQGKTYSEIAAFDKLFIATGGVVTVTHSENPQVRVSGDSPDVEDIKLEQEGTHLRLYCSERCPEDRIFIEIATARIRKLTLQSGGELQVAKGFLPVHELSVSLEHGGVIDAAPLAAGRAHVALHDGGVVRVQVRDELDARVASGGVVEYLGDPQITAGTHQGGAVRRMGRHGEHGQTIDPRDGQRYRTLSVGDREWMTENLAYLPVVCNAEDADCGHWVYGYEGTSLSMARESAHFRQHGALYGWNQAQTACPPNWRLPTDHDWYQLEWYLGVPADQLQQDVWRTMETAAAAVSLAPGSFNMHYPGWRTGYGEYHREGEHANFWVAEAADDEHALERLFGLNNPKVGRHTGIKQCGFSVRCVMDVGQEDTRGED